MSAQSNANIFSAARGVSFKEVMERMKNDKDYANAVATAAGDIRHAKTMEAKRAGLVVFDWINTQWMKKRVTPAPGKMPSRQEVITIMTRLVRQGSFQEAGQVSNKGVSNDPDDKERREKDNANYTWIIAAQAVPVSVDLRACLAAVARNDDYAARAKLICEHVDAHIVSTGSAHAVYNRLMKVAVCEMDIAERVKNLTILHCDAVPERPLEYDMRAWSYEQLAERYVMLRATASCGAPWPREKQTTPDQSIKHFEWAEEAWETAKNLQALQKYLTNEASEFPAKFLVLMKAKFERMKLADYDVKARPYFVAPLWWNLLGKIVYGAVKETVLRFDEDPRALTSVGFSWCYGGAEKLVKHMERAKPTEPVFVCQGDDQCIAVRLTTGQLCFLMYDVSGMDFNLSKDAGAIAYAVYSRRMKDKVPKNLLNAFAMIEMKRFTCDVNIGCGPYVMRKIKGNLSGLSGTTEVNDIMSQVSWLDNKVYLSGEYDTVEELYEASKNYVSMVRERLGMNIKEETIAPVVQTEEYPIPAPFLGYRVRRHKVYGLVPEIGEPLDHFLPAFRPMVAGDEYKKKDSESIHNKIRRQFDSICGCYASGGYLDPMYVEFAQHAIKQTKEAAEANQTDLYDVESAEINQCLPELFNTDERRILFSTDLPLPEVVAVLYTGTREQFLAGKVRVRASESTGEIEELNDFSFLGIEDSDDEEKQYDVNQVSIHEAKTLKMLKHGPATMLSPSSDPLKSAPTIAVKNLRVLKDKARKRDQWEREVRQARFNSAKIALEGRYEVADMGADLDDYQPLDDDEVDEVMAKYDELIRQYEDEDAWIDLMQQARDEERAIRDGIEVEMHHEAAVGDDESLRTPQVNIERFVAHVVRSRKHR